MSGESSVPDWQMAVLSVLTGRRDNESKLPGVSPNPNIRVSPSGPHVKLPLKVPFPNTVILRVKASIYEFGDQGQNLVLSKWRGTR